MSLTKYANLILATTLVAACGGDDKPANTAGVGAQQCPPGQYFDGRLCQNMQGTEPTTTAPPPAGTVAGTPAPGATAAPPVPIATTQTGPTAQPLDPTAAQAATQALTALAQQHAMPGAKPVGSAIAGNFQQGQSLEAQVQMNPGKCYTIVGAGLPPVQNLDIQIVPAIAMPGLPQATLAADQTVGPDAVVGDKPNCFKWALPMGGMVKVVVTVSQGSGIAAAQVFEK
jgi:hypothetical protein